MGSGMYHVISTSLLPYGTYLKVLYASFDFQPAAHVGGSAENQ